MSVATKEMSAVGELAEASDRSTAPERLSHLARSPNIDVRVRVAENPSTPRWVAERLMWDRSSEVLDALADRAGLTWHDLEFLAARGSVRAQRALAKNPCAPQRAATYWVERLPPDEIVALLRAAPPGAGTSWILEGDVRNLRLVAAVAEHAALPVRVWPYFAAHRSEQVRRAFARRREEGDRRQLHRALVELGEKYPGRVLDVEEELQRRRKHRGGGAGPLR